MVYWTSFFKVCKECRVGWLKRFRGEEASWRKSARIVWGEAHICSSCIHRGGAGCLQRRRVLHSLCNCSNLSKPVTKPLYASSMLICPFISGITRDGRTSGHRVKRHILIRSWCLIAGSKGVGWARYPWNACQGYSFSKHLQSRFILLVPAFDMIIRSYRFTHWRRLLRAEA